MLPILVHNRTFNITVAVLAQATYFLLLPRNFTHRVTTLKSWAIPKTCFQGISTDIKIQSFRVYQQVYLEDALGERVWVDRQDCKLFVDNLLTAFNTKIPPSSMLQSEVGKSDQTASAGNC